MNLLSFKSNPQYKKQDKDARNCMIFTDKELAKTVKKILLDFNKWNHYTTNKLVKESRQNKAWLKVRKDLDPNEVCFETVDELTPEFLKIN